MTWTFRAAMVLVAVLGMNLVGCGGGGGEAGSPEGSPVVRSSEEDLDGPMAVEGPPDVAGTWVGGYERGGGGTLMPRLDEFEEEGGGTLMLSFGQDGEQLTGYGTAALMGEEYPLILHGLAGRVTPDGEVSATANIYGEPTDEPLFFAARVTGSETMEYRGEGVREEDSIELERARTDLPGGMGLAAVQAVYSRDWVWFAEHGSGDLEDGLEVDYGNEVEPNETYGEFAQMLSMQYEGEMTYAEEEDEPAFGVRVMLDEGSVVTNEVDSSRVTVEFDFTTSDGRGGDADVSLVRAGTTGSGFSYQIDGFGMEYEAETGATYDMSMSQ